MRIAVLTTGFPRFEGDVAGCFVEGFVEVLRACGHEVIVFAPEPRERISSSRDHVRWVPYARPRALARTFYGAGVPDNVVDPRAWFGLASYPIALRVAAHGRWDAVVAHFGIPCGLVATTLDSPRVLTVWHSADVALASRLPRRVSSSMLSTGMHWLVRPEHHGALRPRRAIVSPMGVHAPREMSREEARVRLRLDERPVVLFLGRLVPIKGGDLLARALASRRDVQLVIAGEGPERVRLARLAPSARFLGHVTGADKDAAWSAADVVVLPSRGGRSGRGEGAPLVAIEAALVGRARVVSRSIGVGEDEAWVFDDDDVTGLVRAIDAALVGGSSSPRTVCARERAAQLTWTALGPLVESTVLDAHR